MPDQDDDGPQGTGTKWAAVAGVAAIACCVGHTLLLAIGLGAVGSAVGAALGQALVIIPAAAVLVVAIAIVTIRRRQASGSTTRRISRVSSPGSD